MSTVDPKATMALLRGLQRIDGEVERIRRRIQEMPQLLERRAERWRQAQARVSSAEARILDAKKQIGLIELDVKVKDGEIAKIQGAQGQSRTNEEFRAYGDQITRIRRDKTALEDTILEHLARIESIEAELVDLRSTAATLKGEVDADRAQWEKDEAEYQAELAKRLAERAEFVRQVAPGPLSIYERVLKLRSGKAMVPATGKVCGGCQMALTPNDYRRVQGGQELVTCRSCERLLYLDETATTAR